MLRVSSIEDLETNEELAGLEETFMGNRDSQFNGLLAVVWQFVKIPYLPDDWAELRLEIRDDPIEMIHSIMQQLPKMVNLAFLFFCLSAILRYF